MSALAPLLEAFFTERLIGQRQASPHTVAAYRDAFCLLLRFAQRRTGKAPHQLTIEDIDALLVGAFLSHLEAERGVCTRTRNARLTAIRSLFHFAAYRHPEHAGLIQRVLAIPPKRTDKTIVTYLGSGGGITRCWCSLWRQACGLASSPGSPARQSSSAPEPTFAATAKGARSGSRPCGERFGRCCKHGSTSVAGLPAIPSSPGRMPGGSAETPSGALSSATSPRQPASVPRSQPRTFPPTRFATAAP
jgi:hypothetical protein